MGFALRDAGGAGGGGSAAVSGGVALFSLVGSVDVSLAGDQITDSGIEWPASINDNDVFFVALGQPSGASGGFTAAQPILGKTVNDLGEITDELPHTTSGENELIGMQLELKGTSGQGMSYARVFIGKDDSSPPKLLIADEGSGNVDPMQLRVTKLTGTAKGSDASGLTIVEEQPDDVPAAGAMIYYSVAATSLTDTVDKDGSTSKTSAAVGDIFRSDGTSWVYQGGLS